jgi:hypothetical protein
MGDDDLDLFHVDQFRGMTAERRRIYRRRSPIAAALRDSARWHRKHR